ncbi:hypothetical protein BJV77DRAFT_998829 [Russula vinacea]|nr:hypothetical protein BJV77DRAFT_998829 [Russula vinacea]
MYQENDDALILDTSVYTMMTSMPITDDSRGLRPDDFLPNVDGRQDIPRRDCRPTRIVRQVAAVGTTAQIVSSPLLSCCSLRNLVQILVARQVDRTTTVDNWLLHPYLVKVNKYSPRRRQIQVVDVHLHLLCRCRCSSHHLLLRRPGYSTCRFALHENCASITKSNR